MDGKPRVAPNRSRRQTRDASNSVLRARLRFTDHRESSRAAAVQRAVREGELPEAAVARIEIQLIPSAVRATARDQSTRDEPEDPLVDHVVRRRATTLRPGTDELGLVRTKIVR